jgi:hypothetical protein
VCSSHLYPNGATLVWHVPFAATREASSGAGRAATAAARRMTKLAAALLLLLPPDIANRSKLKLVRLRLLCRRIVDEHLDLSCSRLLYCISELPLSIIIVLVHRVVFSSDERRRRRGVPCEWSNKEISQLVRCNICLIIFVLNAGARKGPKEPRYVVSLSPTGEGVRLLRRTFDHHSYGILGFKLDNDGITIYVWTTFAPRTDYKHSS